MKPEPLNKKEANLVTLPPDGREGMAADSVFTPSKSKDISIIGEIFRKLIHLGAIAIPIGYHFLGIGVVIPVLALCLTTSLCLDYIRIFGNRKSRHFIRRYMGIMIRPSEKRDFIGASYILSGSILTILLFDKPIAIAAISFIVIGDTAGAIIGRIWGKVRFRDKSLEGSVSFLVACLLAGIVIPAIPFWVKIVGAITATIVEAITLHIDDNLIVPVTSGAIMQVIVSQMVILKYFS